MAGGCHIIGTTAVDILLKNHQLLGKLLAETENMQYWQALIPITEVGTRDSAPFATAVDIEAVQTQEADVDYSILGDLLSISKKNRSYHAKSYPTSSDPDTKRKRKNKAFSNQIPLRLVSVERSTLGSNYQIPTSQQLLRSPIGPSYLRGDTSFFDSGETQMRSNFSLTLNDYEDDQLIVLVFQDDDDCERAIELKFADARFRKIPYDLPAGPAMIVPRHNCEALVTYFSSHDLYCDIDTLLTIDELEPGELSQLRSSSLAPLTN